MCIYIYIHLYILIYMCIYIFTCILMYTYINIAYLHVFIFSRLVF